jgi:hypothetical protein
LRADGSRSQHQQSMVQVRPMAPELPPPSCSGEAMSEHTAACCWCSGCLVAGSAHCVQQRGRSGWLRTGWAGVQLQVLWQTSCLAEHATARAARAVVLPCCVLLLIAVSCCRSTAHLCTDTQTLQGTRPLECCKGLVVF